METFCLILLYLGFASTVVNAMMIIGAPYPRFDLCGGLAIFSALFTLIMAVTIASVFH
jgi:hypothetical protein